MGGQFEEQGRALRTITDIFFFLKKGDLLNFSTKPCATPLVIFDILSTLTISDDRFSSAHSSFHPNRLQVKYGLKSTFFAILFLIFTGWSIRRHLFKHLSVKFQKINFATN